MAYQKFVPLRHVFLWDVTAGAVADSTATSGTIPIFSAPANCLIRSVRAQVLTAVTGATSEILGDGTDTDGYLVDGFAANTGTYPTSAEDVNIGVFMKATTAGATDAADVSNSAEIKVYGSADTIDFVLGGTATAGKIRFYVDFEVVA